MAQWLADNPPPRPHAIGARYGGILKMPSEAWTEYLRQLMAWFQRRHEFLHQLTGGDRARTMALEDGLQELARKHGHRLADLPPTAVVELEMQSTGQRSRQ